MLRYQIIVAVTAVFFITGHGDARGTVSTGGETNTKIYAATKHSTSKSDQNLADQP